MIDITQAILSLQPNAAFICKGNNYNRIQWLSPQVPKPSFEDILKEIDRLEKLEPIKILRERRNQLLQQTDCEIQRNTERNIDSTELITYRNALRDLPQEIESGNISAPTIDDQGNLIFDNWPVRGE